MTKWTLESEAVPGGERWRIRAGNEHLDYGSVLRLWCEAEFAQWYTAAMVDAPYRAVFWEQPPLTTARLQAAYECVLLDAPALERMGTDHSSFKEQCSADKDVVVFPNLGGDATLIAPSVLTEAHYPHLMAFLLRAPQQQLASFWRRVGATTLQLANERPLWLSTSGLGIAWLHARVDAQPKYYQHRPYTVAPATAAN